MTRVHFFWQSNSLGPNQKDNFVRFLQCAGLKGTEDITQTFAVLSKYGYENPTPWGVILANLAYNAQFAWYIRTLNVGITYERETVKHILENEEHSERVIKSLISAWKRMVDLPLGTVLRFGQVGIKGNQVTSLTRTKCEVTDSRVVLYSLYKFAEACEGYYQFSLTRLLNHEIDFSGMSPTLIFGLNQEDMEGFLNGLTVQYPEFIHATFTHDLDKISLMEDKTSEDVLKLF